MRTRDVDKAVSKRIDDMNMLIPNGWIAGFGQGPPSIYAGMMENVPPTCDQHHRPLHSFPHAVRCKGMSIVPRCRACRQGTPPIIECFMGASLLHNLGTRSMNLDVHEFHV